MPFFSLCLRASVVQSHESPPPYVEVYKPQRHREEDKLVSRKKILQKSGDIGQLHCRAAKTLEE